MVEFSREKGNIPKCLALGKADIKLFLPVFYLGSGGHQVTTNTSYTLQDEWNIHVFCEGPHATYVPDQRATGRWRMELPNPVIGR
jgi:hypothetical protein